MFGFAWGFGAIFFGMSVDRLGVSLANSLVIGLSSALGSLVPLFLGGAFALEPRHFLLFGGVAVFLAGVAVCGSAGRMRDRHNRASTGAPWPATSSPSLPASCPPSSTSATRWRNPWPRPACGLGYSRFTATNFIWLLMLLAGSLSEHRLLRLSGVAQLAAAGLFFQGPAHRTWGLSMLMGLLWGASISLYGAATPLLGDIGPSIGWPLSLAVGLLVANFMGALLGEWRADGPGSRATHADRVSWYFCSPSCSARWPRKQAHKPCPFRKSSASSKVN